MPNTFLWIIIFVISLFTLIKASDCFTDASEKIGLYFGLPSFVIGVTIVAIGTSLPELVSSIVAVLKNSPEIVVGNVIGSNITNILLVLGVAAIIGKEIKITYKNLYIDVLLLLASAFLLSLTVLDGEFTLPEALTCLLGAVFYLAYTLRIEKEPEHSETKKTKKLETKTIAILVGSSVFIYLGAEYTVESVLKLSEIFKMGKEVIAISAVAFGTSLPELTVTITAAKKGNPEMAIGNVLGSNIFNTFVVMGIPALFGSLLVPRSILNFGLPMMLVATLLYFFVIYDRKVKKWEGWLLLVSYLFFIGKVLNLF